VGTLIKQHPHLQAVATGSAVTSLYCIGHQNPQKNTGFSENYRFNHFFFYFSSTKFKITGLPAICPEKLQVSSELCAIMGS